MNPDNVRKMLTMAKLAGCPDDQVRQLLNSGYVPFPWQWRFHAASRQADYDGGPVDIGLGGARGPGKSHAVLSQAALDDCQRISGLKGLFLRQTGSSAKESFDDLVFKVLQGHVIMEHQTNSIQFPNGSRILLGGFHSENDIDKYIGIEYDFIIVEELNQLTLAKYNKLRGSLRTSKPNWRPRIYTSFNPGGIGHIFVKERYIIPFRENKQRETRFIGATYKENINLDRTYIDYLESLQGDLGKAWREGDWDMFAGQYFDEWRYDKHVCEPFTIPDRWPRFRSIDPSGRSGVTACHWYTVDSDGRVYCYKEYYATGRDMDEHAREIARKSVDKEGNEEKYLYTVIDSAAFANAGYSETCIDIYERHGVTGFIKAAKERVVGWNDVHTYLRLDKPTLINSNPQPKLKIFKTCTNLIREIPSAQHDEKNPEDVDAKYTGAEHLDALDDLRYFLRTLRQEKAPPPMNAIEMKLKNHLEQEQVNNFNYSRPVVY